MTGLHQRGVAVWQITKISRDQVDQPKLLEVGGSDGQRNRVTNCLVEAVVRAAAKDKGLVPVGTLVDIVEISKVYDTSEMDIKTRGQKVFRVLEIIDEVPDKLYSGAIVSYPANTGLGKKLLMSKVIFAIKDLHKLLKVKRPFHKNEDDLNSYDVAHHAGLTLKEEYEFLTLTNELQRQEYLKRHLAKVLPVVAEMELLKEKIKLNGHFKNISGFNIS